MSCGVAILFHKISVKLRKFIDLQNAKPCQHVTPSAASVVYLSVDYNKIFYVICVHVNDILIDLPSQSSDFVFQFS